MRLQINFLHFFSESDDYSPSCQLVMTFLASFSFVVQHDEVTSDASQGMNIRIRLKSGKIGWSNHKFAVVGRIQEVELTGDLNAKKKRGAVAHLLAKFGMHDEQIILTNFGDDQGMSSLGVAGVIALIVADQLLAGLVRYGKMSLNIGETSACVLLISEENIESSLNRLHPQCFISPFLSHQVLFQSHQRSSMTCVLSDLNKSVPIVRSKTASAVRALRIFFHKLNNFSLLDASVLVDCSHEVDLDAYAFGVRFSPHEFGIPQLGLIESSDLLQHCSQQLRAFSLAVDPGRSFIAVAIDAVLLLLIGGEDGFVLEGRERAGGTDVLFGGGEFDTAEGTEDAGFLLNKHIKELLSSINQARLSPLKQKPLQSYLAHSLISFVVAKFVALCL